MSLLMMSFGIMPLGILPIALAVDEFGAPATVAVSSTLMLASLLLFFALSSRLRHLSVDALAHAELSPAQAAALVAQGKISQDDAERLTGRRPGQAHEATSPATPSTDSEPQLDVATGGNCKSAATTPVP